MNLPSDEAQFRKLFDTHYRAIQRYCLRRLDHEQANDAAAEVFVVAWRRRETMPEPSAAGPWLYGVARNVIRHAYRTQRRYRNLAAKAATPDPPDSFGPASQLIRREEDEHLIAALELLHESDQELLRLKIWDELSHAEVADVLGISPHAAGMRYRRALQRMARALRQVEGRPARAMPQRSEGGAQ